MIRALLLALTVLFALPAAAHEGRPVLVKLKAEGPAVQLRWQVPPVVPAGAEPALALQGCTGPMPRAGLLGHAAYTCPDGLDAAAIQIMWPNINPALSTLVELDGGQTRFFGPEVTQIPLTDFAGPGTDFPSFIETGVEHILLGYDHLLFILALTLIVLMRPKDNHWKRLGLMVTGFTLAHSVTLGLATFDVIRLPAPPVEASIALSILFVCVELARNDQRTLTWRYPVLTASAFGLLHGLGFASVLAEAGLKNGKLLALLGFNLGVELGQLVFVAFILLAAFAATRALPKGANRPAYSVLVFAMGGLSAYWLIDRMMQF